MKARATIFALGILAVVALATPASAVSVTTPYELYTTPVQSAPAAVAWSPGTATVFVANTGSGTVSVIDELAGGTVENIYVGPAPQGIVVDSVHQRVYVALGETNKVAALDAYSGRVLYYIGIAQCTGPTGPWGLAVNPATDTLYVACYSANTLVSITGSTGRLIKAVPTGGGPLGLALDPVTNQLYVGQIGESEIRVLDGTTLLTTSSIRRGIFPGIWGLALDPITHRVFAANYTRGTVQVILASRVLSTYSGFSGPEWIGYDAVRGRVWIPEFNAGRVTGLDPLNGDVTPVAVHGTKPAAVDVNPALGIVYSANFGTLNVSAIAE
ncbi:MAG: hypothetical protein NVSMB57_13290 [Actinomycetota bacterium]